MGRGRTSRTHAGSRKHALMHAFTELSLTDTDVTVADSNDAQSGPSTQGRDLQHFLINPS